MCSEEPCSEGPGSGRAGEQMLRPWEEKQRGCGVGKNTRRRHVTT